MPVPTNVKAEWCKITNGTPVETYRLLVGRAPSPISHVRRLGSRVTLVFIKSDQAWSDCAQSLLLRYTDFVTATAVTVQRGQRSPHSGPAGMSTPPIAVAAGRNPLSTTAVTPPHLGLRPL
ncbi:hypothetical protein Bbelb_433010 [Branchiostoma belcheri]|nr:hypothetical protein Bbelb_433010 [Branchiostoma belcheri]